MFTRSAIFDIGQSGVGVEMAGTGAVAQFSDPIEHCRWFLVFFVRAGFEIPGMASCAVGPVGRRRPDTGFGVAPVAICAIKPRGMSGGISAGQMCVANPGPVCCYMATVALRCSHEMAVGLAGCHIAVVTAGTGSGNG